MIVKFIGPSFECPDTMNKTYDIFDDVKKVKYSNKCWYENRYLRGLKSSVNSEYDIFIGGISDLDNDDLKLNRITLEFKNGGETNVYFNTSVYIYTDNMVLIDYIDYGRRITEKRKVNK